MAKSEKLTVGVSIEFINILLIKFLPWMTRFTLVKEIVCISSIFLCRQVPIAWGHQEGPRMCIPSLPCPRHRTLTTSSHLPTQVSLSLLGLSLTPQTLETWYASRVLPTEKRKQQADDSKDGISTTSVTSAASATTTTSASQKSKRSRR